MDRFHTLRFSDACPCTEELLTTAMCINGIILHLLVQAADFFEDKDTFQRLCELLCQMLQRLSDVGKLEESLRSSATSFRYKNTRKRRRTEGEQQLVHDAVSRRTLQVCTFLVRFRVCTMNTCKIRKYTETVMPVSVLSFFRCGYSHMSNRSQTLLRTHMLELCRFLINFPSTSPSLCCNLKQSSQ